MTPDPATLRACRLAEHAYQHAARRDEPAARAARLAAVHAAIADGWTQQRIADAMGKSRGWVGQRAPKVARAAADDPSAPSNLTSDELDRRLELARSAPGVAHLILSGPSPTCELCGGTEAPIVDGRHLHPEQWCRRPQDPAPIPVRALDRFRRTDR